VDRALLLYPDPQSIVLNLNNVYYKTFEDFWQYYFESNPDGEQYVLQNWPVPVDTNINDIAVWIKREWLSLWFVPWWLDMLEWYLPDRWKSDHCQLILLQDLLYNFESTMQKLQKFCNLEFKKNIADLVPMHDTMLSLQQYRFQGRLCHNIVTCTLTNQPLEWGELPLLSQSWIQWELRNQGYEIRCFGLDTFPTNSVQLRELLYPV